MSEVAEWGDLIGKPFQLGGRGPDAFDCYGLVQEMYRRVGKEIPDYLRPDALARAHAVVDGAKQQWARTTERPGAVAVIRLVRNNGHVGIVLPFGKLLHVWERSGGVTVEPIEEWSRRIEGYYAYTV